jgi:hypothetical protein
MPMTKRREREYDQQPIFGLGYPSSAGRTLELCGFALMDSAATEAASMPAGI